MGPLPRASDAEPLRETQKSAFSKQAPPPRGNWDVRPQVANRCFYVDEGDSATGTVSEKQGGGEKGGDTAAEELEKGRGTAVSRRILEGQP